MERGWETLLFVSLSMLLSTYYYFWVVRMWTKLAHAPRFNGHKEVKWLPFYEMSICVLSGIRWMWPLGLIVSTWDFRLKCSWLLYLESTLCNFYLRKCLIKLETWEMVSFAQKRHYFCCRVTWLVELLLFANDYYDIHVNYSNLF